MNMGLKWSLVAILAVAMAAPLAAHDPAKPTATAAAALPQAVQDAAAVTDAFHAALHGGDTVAALRMLTDDVLIYESGGAERSKAEYAAHHLGADAEFTRATTRAVSGRTGRVIGDIAWVATDSRTTGTFRDRAIDAVGTETMILVRTDGAWRIAHIHWSSGKPG